VIIYRICAIITALHVTAINSNENFEMDGDEEQNRVAGINIYNSILSLKEFFRKKSNVNVIINVLFLLVIQLASMSQHYPLATDANGSTYNRATALSLILSSFYVLIITNEYTCSIY